MSPPDIYFLVQCDCHRLPGDGAIAPPLGRDNFRNPGFLVRRLDLYLVSDLDLAADDGATIAAAVFQCSIDQLHGKPERPRFPFMFDLDLMESFTQCGLAKPRCAFASPNDIVAEAGRTRNRLAFTRSKPS